MGPVRLFPAPSRTFEPQYFSVRCSGAFACSMPWGRIFTMWPATNSESRSTALILSWYCCAAPVPGLPLEEATTLAGAPETLLRETPSHCSPH